MLPPIEPDQPDSTEFYNEVNHYDLMEDDEADAPSMPEGGGAMSSDMVYAFHDMISLMDTLQVLGVDAVQANRYVCSLVRSKIQPSVMEAYGRGKIVAMANGQFRNLNILGEQALDLRTQKPSGGNWDFSLASDRKEATRVVLEKKSPRG